MEFLPVRAIYKPGNKFSSIFSEGNGRVTIFAGQSNARTFDYQAGDIGKYRPHV